MKRTTLMILAALLAATAQLTAQTINWNTGVSYLYDDAGNIARIGTDYQIYDWAGRVIRSDTNGVQRTFEYDAFGNRQKCLQAGGTDCQPGLQVSGTTNRLALASYDSAGNVTQFDGHTYTYDALNMQTRDVQGVVVRDYVYTADDERIAVYTPGNGAWRWTVRDTSGKVLRELTSQDAAGAPAAGSWTWVKDYVYRDNLLLASRQLEQGTPTTYHYHLDHLGTPRRITDATDLIVGQHHYHAFGPELTQGRIDEPSLTALKYTGHERDGDLDYMHARYYDMDVGRFLSVDPTWESADSAKPQTWNRYSYGLNNPINVTDPDGRLPFFFQLLLELGTEFVTDGAPTSPSADDPPRSKAEFDQRVAAGLALQMTYQTYIKVNPETGEVYSGRTSGTGTPEQNVARRDASHHKNAEGYGPAQLDKSSTNEAAIRGREQQLIDANGGARSRGGTSGNAINAISDKNPKKGKYLREAVKEFGQAVAKFFL